MLIYIYQKVTSLSNFLKILNIQLTWHIDYMVVALLNLVDNVSGFVVMYRFL
jgi:hypothetical protein